MQSLSHAKTSPAATSDCAWADGLGRGRREEGLGIGAPLGNAHEQHSSLPYLGSIPSPDADRRGRNRHKQIRRDEQRFEVRISRISELRISDYAFLAYLARPISCYTQSVDSRVGRSATCPASAARIVWLTRSISPISDRGTIQASPGSSSMR